MSKNPKLSQETYDNQQMALAFVSSMRGQYIMSQALEVAIDTLDTVPGVFKEASNIEDMRFIRKYLFNFPVSDHWKKFIKTVTENEAD